VAHRWPPVVAGRPHRHRVTRVTLRLVGKSGVTHNEQVVVKKSGPPASAPAGARHPHAAHQLGLTDIQCRHRLDDLLFVVLHFQPSHLLGSATNTRRRRRSCQGTANPVLGSVESGRGAGLTASPFPRPAGRTRRACLRAQGASCVFLVGQAGGGGNCRVRRPGSWDTAAVVAVAGHGDAGSGGERDPIFGDSLAVVTEPTADLQRSWKRSCHGAGRASVHSCGSAPMCLAASTSIKTCEIVCGSRRELIRHRAP
jgi:hypothetical protein